MCLLNGSGKEVLIISKLKEIINDEKFIKLYHTLTESNYRGDLVDSFIIELLYAMMTLDLVNGSEEYLDFKPRVLRDMAKEVLRIFETDERTASMYSVANWCMALIQYMRENKLKYSDIHKMSTYELRKNVRKYLKEGDD